MPSLSQILLSLVVWKRHSSSLFCAFCHICITFNASFHLPNAILPLIVRPRSNFSETNPEFFLTSQALVTHITPLKSQYLPSVVLWEFMLTLVPLSLTLTPRISGSCIFLRGTLRRQPRIREKKKSLPWNLNSRAMWLFQVKITFLQWIRTQSEFLQHHGRTFSYPESLWRLAGEEMLSKELRKNGEHSLSSLFHS